MSRTVVNLDDELRAEARAILGTRTIRETVTRSLAEVVRLAAARREPEVLFGARDGEEHRQWVVPAGRVA